MVFKTVEGLKDAVSAEEHTVKGKKVKAASQGMSFIVSEGGGEEGAGEAGQSVRGEAESRAL